MFLEIAHNDFATTQQLLQHVTVMFLHGLQNLVVFDVLLELS